MDTLVTLDRVGMGEDATGEANRNLLVDFIVYMAMEDISFFRFLDFGEGEDACKKLLGWLDHEYLAEGGSYSSSWGWVRDRLCNDVGTPLRYALAT